MARLFMEWTKRLGQQHWSELGAPETLCGKSMLGNNYAADLTDDQKIPCPQCAEKRKHLEQELK